MSRLIMNRMDPNPTVNGAASLNQSIAEIFKASSRHQSLSRQMEMVTAIPSPKATPTMAPNAPPTNRKTPIQTPINLKSPLLKIEAPYHPKSCRPCKAPSAAGIQIAPIAASQVGANGQALFIWKNA